MAATKPQHIEVIGGQVHNLKNINLQIPLNKFVAISGLSGSGKSSLAMGILYAEGSRRYLEALSTYTRRRINQSKRSQVQEVRHIPAAIALRQRPSVPSERSTVGSISEIFNVVRLIFSRLGSPVCPNGHRLAPNIKIAQVMDLTDSRMGILTCPVCGVQFAAKAAEDFAFNGQGACPTCHGTGQVRQINPERLIGDENKSLQEGAVASWHLPGRNFMPKVVQTLGVRIDVPYKDLTDHEKDIILHGAKKQYPVDLNTSTGRVFHMEKALYENAYEAIYDTAKKTLSARAQKQLNQFFYFSTCPTCQGSRLNPQLLTQLSGGLNIAQVAQLSLGQLTAWLQKINAELPSNMHKLAQILFEDLSDNLRPLLDLGLDYLTLERSANTLSTGELQRIQLAKTLRTQTTGVLYVLDEPSIGLHPDNVHGLIKILRGLIAQGNSLVVVDHDVDIIAAADWIIEMGPGSGAAGGQVICQGSPQDLVHNPDSLIGPFISGTATILNASDLKPASNFTMTSVTVDNYFNLKHVHIQLPEQQITAVTGYSGAGKTSLILDSLIPALKNSRPPRQVGQLSTNLKHVVSVDASPIGKNARSTVATYTKIMDHLRTILAQLPAAQQQHLTRANFSYNNKQGACPNCGGLGMITLDIQYLPDMEEVCPVCHGDRFNPQIQQIKWHNYSIVDLLQLSVQEALPVFAQVPVILHQLELLQQVGLGYLHLGESTPSLSGGEAQRLKLVKHLNKQQAQTLFVFDEPSVGLHPLDVQTLLRVINQLKSQGATVIVITHDLDIMINADYLIDLGPKGGAAGGQVMASGRPLELIKKPTSLTLQYLAKHYHKYQQN
ncbi:ATP-binding cassette domain-containing protein [Bombilactobacillus bombi]|uniref:ATP-binding cassette domain-containing protein n=1 Tax=Bombilactobacillus bombi TaxID=1303590 RepID=UPI001C62848C|nr:excinuclease ABC subunit UvrA [Bombilactobacillus bombi]